MDGFYSSAGVTCLDTWPQPDVKIVSIHITFAFPPYLAIAFLFLLLHFHNVIGRDALQDTHLLLDHFDDVSTDIALDDDLIQPLRIFCHRRSTRKLGGKQLCSLFQVHSWTGLVSPLRSISDWSRLRTERFQPVYRRHVFVFVSLNPFYRNRRCLGIVQKSWDRRGVGDSNLFLLGLYEILSFRFRFLLRCVFL